MRAPVGRHDTAILSVRRITPTSSAAGRERLEISSIGTRSRISEGYSMAIPRSINSYRTMDHSSYESLAPRWNRSKIATDVGDNVFVRIESISAGGREGRCLINWT